MHTVYLIAHVLHFAKRAAGAATAESACAIETHPLPPASQHDAHQESSGFNSARQMRSAHQDLFATHDAAGAQEVGGAQEAAGAQK